MDGVYQAITSRPMKCEAILAGDVRGISKCRGYNSFFSRVTEVMNDPDSSTPTSEVRVQGRYFAWRVIPRTAQYSPLLHFDERVDVLYIREETGDVELAIRIDSDSADRGRGRKKPTVFLGAALVLSLKRSGSEPVETGWMIDLRPKLRSLSDGEIDGADVEAIIQFILSTKFELRRIDAFGERWTAPG